MKQFFRAIMKIGGRLFPMSRLVKEKILDFSKKPKKFVKGSLRVRSKMVTIGYSAIYSVEIDLILKEKSIFSSSFNLLQKLLCRIETRMAVFLFYVYVFVVRSDILVRCFGSFWPLCKIV